VIVNDEIPDRIDAARKLGEVVLDSTPIEHPAYRTRWCARR
jgi:hypothetical protein